MVWFVEGVFQEYTVERVAENTLKQITFVLPAILTNSLQFALMCFDQLSQCFLNNIAIYVQHEAYTTTSWLECTSMASSW